MPILSIETNVPASGISDEAVEELIAAVAETLDKPAGYVKCTVKPGLMIAMGLGENAKKPCALVSLESIGKLGVEENKKHSAKLFPLISQHFRIPEDRLTITFTDFLSHNVGLNGTTVRAIRGE